VGVHKVRLRRWNLLPGLYVLRIGHWILSVYCVFNETAGGLFSSRPAGGLRKNIWRIAAKTPKRQML